MKDYFCEHCFEDKNIKKYIKDNGEIKKEKFDCDFCPYETDIDKWEIDDCIDEYHQKCMETHEEKLTEKEFEDREIELDEQCKTECKEKYQMICEDKFIEPTFVIEQEKLIKKFREVILKLYTYDFDSEADYLYNYAEKDGLDEWNVDALMAHNEVYTLEEVFEGLNIDFDEGFKNNLKDIFNKHICSSNTYKDYEEIEWLRNEDRLWKYNCLYSTDEYRLQNWEAFREHTKHKARYFEHQKDKENKFSVIKTLKDFEPFFTKMTTLNDELIYRVRPIYKDEDKEDIRSNPSKELGKIPIDKLEYTRNNRFSPIGISYGYFAFDEKTALIESRVNINDEVGIGEFKLDKSLKLIDFRDKKLSEYLNPFSKNFDINVYCNSFFLNAFLTDISKPISDDDSLLEYVPTQIMAEYIWSIGYDGFIFDSSQKKGGENIVIFGDNPTYRKHKIVRIKNVQYDLEELIL